MDLQYFVELFCGGLTRGSIYALIALGYTMVYGIIELINFAHGEIYMIGAFTALIVASALGIMGFPAAGIIVIAALAAVIWCAAYGYTIEKIAYRPLRGAPPAFAPHLRHRRVDLPPELCEPGSDVRLRGLSAAHHRL